MEKDIEKRFLRDVRDHQKWNALSPGSTSSAGSAVTLRKQ
jgi:hypothetical protein